MNKDKIKQASQPLPLGAVRSSFIKCAITGMKADYRIGVIKYGKSKITKEVGAVVSDKVLDAIDRIQTAFFGRNFWAVVMDLNGIILYRSDYADMDKISAKEGWRQYVAKNCG